MACVIRILKSTYCSVIPSVFKYPDKTHNVIPVNSSGFQQCALPTGRKSLRSGSDVITLRRSGKKWYIGGVTGHCEIRNQKLFAMTELPHYGLRHLRQLQLHHQGQALHLYTMGGWWLFSASL
ncbi:Basic blue protein [Morella rubra]|uniref:Basic blue protein n=1 Tax=Morella rubra TaxID=262757 RepID=A0A6A1VW17_9ROSI|nr:Basic blue protein [Morella rubra]